MTGAAAVSYTHLAQTIVDGGIRQTQHLAHGQRCQRVVHAEPVSYTHLVRVWKQLVVPVLPLIPVVIKFSGTMANCWVAPPWKKPT